MDNAWWIPGERKVRLDNEQEDHSQEGGTAQGHEVAAYPCVRPPVTRQGWGPVGGRRPAIERGFNMTGTPSYGPGSARMRDDTRSGRCEALRRGGRITVFVQENASA